jgi:hypothetical protein
VVGILKEPPEAQVPQASPVRAIHRGSSEAEAAFWVATSHQSRLSDFAKHCASEKPFWDRNLQNEPNAGGLKQAFDGSPDAPPAAPLVVTLSSFLFPRILIHGVRS